MMDLEGRIQLNTPDSERFQPPQGPGFGAGFARLIVDYPGGHQTGMREWLPRLSRSFTASSQSAAPLLSLVTDSCCSQMPSDI